MTPRPRSMRDDLLPYIKHRYPCEAIIPPVDPEWRRPCTCGLDAIMNPPEGARSGEATPSAAEALCEAVDRAEATFKESGCECSYDDEGRMELECESCFAFKEEEWALAAYRKSRGR